MTSINPAPLDALKHQNRIKPAAQPTSTPSSSKTQPAKNSIETIKDLIAKNTDEEVRPEMISEGERIAKLSDSELSKELDALTDILLSTQNSPS